ncbi:MAG: hypothetical protein QSU88_08950, partial [Candidatus Methanoperedens sp.]|nr:hypothetical protein [Candidatus Methanoperedens sp.]
SAKSFELSGFKPRYGKKIKSIAIGPKTADTMRKYGIHPDFVGNGTLEDCLSSFNSIFNIKLNTLKNK